MASLPTVNALPLSTYAPESVLASGRWVKVSVPQSGIYKITRTQLSQWGFTDLSRVRIHGYGGQRIDDRLSAANYIDDLPLVQSETVGDGIVFYGVGPEQWITSVGDYAHIENNIYSTAGYYFVTESETVPAAISTQGKGAVAEPARTFIERLHHEVDATSPGEAGYVLVGENLKTQNNREFAFSLPGRVSGTDAWMECALVTKNYIATTVTITANGQKLNAVTADNIAPCTKSSYVHATYSVTNHIVPQQGEQLKLTVSLANISNIISAWVDYVSVNYERALALPQSGYLNFSSSSSDLSLEAGNEANVRVWDVTSPSNITRLNTEPQGQSLTWRNDYTGRRQYAAWSENASIPSPEFVGNVTNQNIHAMENTDMVIFTLPEYTAQAERIAQLHAESARPLKVTVLNINEVYNEFSSGAPDVSAMRKCLKMLYDRANEQGGPVVRYALLMGRSTYDNRHLTSLFKGSGAYNTIPSWMTGARGLQFSDNDAFGTDDFIAMLGDNKGTNPGYDDLHVAVGRMPVTSVSEARNVVDKLVKYVNSSKNGAWKNRMLFLADDGDTGIHLQQTEKIIGNIEATPDNQNLISKVYVDAYNLVGGACEGGRKDMFRMLDEGVVWWNYVGHANNHSWTGERMLTYNDINNLYLKNVPVLMAATCDFLRWDSNTISGGEILFHEPNGGTIATISATRPVFISENGYFTSAIGRYISHRDKDGRLPRLGDIYINAKNNLLTEKGDHISSVNRLRFVLMGDPAMELATPDNIVRLDKIGDSDVTPESQVTIMALERTTLAGSVCSPDGQVLTGFNGTVYVDIYDAEKSTTTRGETKGNVEITFEQHGDLLFSGLAEVKDGKFVVQVSMPGEVANNFRPATVNMYACTSDNSSEAVGVNSDFYVYGYDESVSPDTVPPVIESLVLNEDSFRDGDKVNTSPLVMATITDDIGINISASGIGHQMVLTLDGRTTYTDVSLYYTASADGTPGGVINYPLSNLSTGDHTLTLKVWDTASNSSSATINFNVADGLTPTLYKVYTDVNPARTDVKFYITHNRPEAQLTASVTVYDMLGRKLWDTTATLPSDMNTTFPITWDLCDASGHRLPRGIYLYRATISDDNGETYDTATQRLAITAP